MANTILVACAAYLTIGLLFGIPFIARGIERVDPAAHAAPWTFRLLVLPGAIALWPMLALRWQRARQARTPT